MVSDQINDLETSVSFVCFGTERKSNVRSPLSCHLLLRFSYIYVRILLKFITLMLLLLFWSISLSTLPPSRKSNLPVSSRESLLWTLPVPPRVDHFKTPLATVVQVLEVPLLLRYWEPFGSLRGRPTSSLSSATVLYILTPFGPSVSRPRTSPVSFDIYKSRSVTV